MVIIGVRTRTASDEDTGRSARLFTRLAERSRARAAVIGVRAIVIGFLALCAVRILSLKPWVTLDEYQHVDYGLALWRGVAPGYLPDTTQPEMPEQGTFIQHVANHPPLYPYLVGWILRIGVATGHPWASVYVARGVTALMAAAAVALIAATAYRLAGRRAAPAIGAAFVVATCSPLVSVATTVMNDALFITLAAAVVHLTVLVLADGARTRLGVLLVVAATAGMLTRSNALVPLIASSATLLCVGLFPRLLQGGHRSPPNRRRFLMLGALVALVPIVASSWFYLRNLARWGNLFGDHIPGIPYAPAHDSTVTISIRPGFWWYLWNQLYGRPVAGGVTSMQFGSGWPVRPDPIYLWAFWSTVAVVVVAVVGLVRWLAGPRRRPPGPLRGPLLALAWAVPLLVLLGTVAGTASHFSIGGSPHARYFLPGLTFIAPAMAMAAQRWGRLRGVAMGALVLAGLGGIWTFWHSLLARPRVGLGQQSFPQDVVTAMANNGVPAAGLVAGTALLVLGMAFTAAFALYLRPAASATADETAGHSTDRRSSEAG